MLRGDNRTEDKTDNKIENAEDKVQKAFDDVQRLKEKIEKIKEQTEQLTAVNQNESEGTAFSDVAEKNFVNRPDSEAIAAAERAVREHAIREAEEGFDSVHRRELEREKKVEEARRIEQETKQRLEIKKKEADEKQRQLEEAEKRAAEVKRNRQKIEMRSAENHTIRDRELKDAIKRKEEEEKRLRDIENRINREKIIAEQKAAELERIEREKLAKEKERQRKEAEKRAREEEKRAREAEKQARKMALIEKKKEEARLREEENRKKAEREALIAQQRAIQRQKREEEKAELRRIKKEREAKRNEEKAARKQKLREERLQKAELRRQRRIARKSAEIGGGIVNVHGTTIQTEIQPVATFSVKDLLGLSKRKEIKATTSEEERQALLEENERIRQEARATAVQLAEARRQKRESGFSAKLDSFLTFCDEKKKGLLIAVSVVLALAVGTAAVFNYCTAYEYSYNGKALGYVKNKDDVLHITELVQTALSEEKNVDIVIDARDDIAFERVYTFNKDIVIDSSDQVLKRLTYVGDLNVKAFGIYVDGQKVGAVAKKDDAVQVFEGIKSRYATNDEGSVIKKAVIVEKVDVKRSNTSLKEVLSADEMVDKLCTEGLRTTTHTVARGETLDSIATLYNTDKNDILKDNEIPDPEKLEVGSTIVINEMAPIMTVRITEERDYVEKTDYETIKKKDKNMYEGYTEVDQKGQKGVSQIKDRTVTVNGEVVSRKILSEKVQKEPVEKIVRVGTKERPPTVGSGTYIWPAHDGTYVVTSEFKWRWGRQHQGIDMGCSTGTDVLAADGGTVVYAGWMGGYGNLVIIDHQNGVQTYYGHNSALCVKKGDKVFQGQHIAEAGNTGNSFGSHIHFGVNDHGEFKNPRNYLP